MSVDVPIEEVTKLLKLFRGTKLARLSATFQHLVDGPDSVNGLSGFIKIVACNYHADSLRNFQLVYPGVCDAVFSTVFRPLLKFHALKDVAIYGPFSWKLTDEKAAEIASLWPNIRSPRLPLRNLGCSLLSLSALLAFAKCTELRYLSLIVDASDKAV
ncbi:hypothetical protein P691DRAFT_777516 [Macrolepiota fuliginosa MF-IS2]|uniref:Uncharacterized protein n=1 Tax=Macrolepiota fuliginosa MF-IS2 TaxID=1400762 RepID=A0A9P5X6T8_9AGAR|nr:hypothetical protein P691DRAFT_777516 [Macrolepiota fuliginosa MF-IS2]